MSLDAIKPKEESGNEHEFFGSTPHLFDISSWLQSFSSSLKKCDSFASMDFYTGPQIIALVKKCEIQKLNMSQFPDFTKQGLLTNNSIIRILFWYQKIVEQMLFLFKTRMSKCIQSSNSDLIMLQLELDSFISNMNELTKKCQNRIATCISSNTPDHVKRYQPLTESQKHYLIDLLIKSFEVPNSPLINCAAISKKLNIDQKRIESYCFTKRNEIKRYIRDEGDLPKWMITEYSQILNTLKQKEMSKKRFVINIGNANPDIIKVPA